MEFVFDLDWAGTEGAGPAATLFSELLDVATLRPTVIGAALVAAAGFATGVTANPAETEFLGARLVTWLPAKRASSARSAAVIASRAWMSPCAAGEALVEKIGLTAAPLPKVGASKAVRILTAEERAVPCENGFKLAVLAPKGAPPAKFGAGTAKGSCMG
jgi:hypothetical protein